MQEQNYQTNATSLCFNVDISGNPSGSFNGGGMEYVYRNVGSFITPNASNNGYNTILSWNTSGGATFNNGSTFNGDVTITGNLFLPTASSYIRLGGYSYIGEDLTDQDSLTIASDSTESIYFAHFNQATSTYTTTMRIDPSGKLGIGTGTSAIGQKLEVKVASGDGILINSADVATFKMKGGGSNNWGLASTNLLNGDFGIYKSNATSGDPISAGTPALYFLPRTNNSTQIGAGSSGADVEGRFDIRMNFLGQNWVPNNTSAKWSEVWCNAGVPGAYFNDVMLHLNTNRGGGATGGVVGIAFSPGWGGHQNWGIYSYNTTGSSYTSGDLSFVSQINGGDRFERMRLNGVNGCVGIGIDTAPNSNVKLRVVGDFANEWTAEVKSTNTTGQSYGLVVNTLTSAGVYNLGCYTHTGNGFFVQNDGKVGIGTGTATEGRLHVTQSYSAALRTGYFQSSTYSSPHVVYDTFAINQQDVPSLVLVETPAAAVSTHQKLSITVGDANCVFRTSQVSGGMWFNVNGGISSPGYQTTSGTNAIRILNNGYVGINQSTPLRGFHVSADAYITGSVGIGENDLQRKFNLYDGTDTWTRTRCGASTADWIHGIAGSDHTYKWYNQSSNGGVGYKMALATSGTLTVSADVVAYGSPSDIRLKENIKPIESALDKVSKLQGVTFDWKKSDSILDIKEDIGFIAQDVQKVIPELVRESEDGMLSMRHQGIAPILLEAIKELKAEIEELKKHKCNCKE